MKDISLEAPIVAANWKMHPASLRAAQKLFSDVKRTASHLKNVTTVLCPPNLFLGAMSADYSGSKIILGSQDVSEFSDVGSQTGEVSAEMLADSGARVAIIGHSERRALGEDTDLLIKKTKNALNAELSVIYCIGESERDEAGSYLRMLESQITDLFTAIPGRLHEKITIAYEPLWAIGGGEKNAVTPHDLHQATLFIRKVLRANFSNRRAKETNILYGGSVKRGNAKELFAGTGVDGFLIGGASLSADHFTDILRVVNDLKSENE